MDSVFNGHTYYGNLITVTEAFKMYDDGDYVLSTNGIQGEAGRELLEALNNLNIDVFLDLDEDRADTIFFVVYKNTPASELLDLMDIVCNAKPDEFSNTNKNTYRMWWD